MAKLTLNSVTRSILTASKYDVADNTTTRARIVSAGRNLYYDHAAQNAVRLNGVSRVMNNEEYRQMNEKFQESHLMYAAKRCCDITGEAMPESFAEFKRQGQRFASNEFFLRTLQGVYTEIITPILPAVLSNAVGVFADMEDVGFGETKQITVESNEIPIFQDSAWGAHRSTPRNRFYAKDYTLNPQPRTAQIFAKWYQLVANGTDFGRFFSNIAAGMYAKIMGMWNQAITAAASNTALIPSNLSVTYNTTNWVTLANKVAAVNNTNITNLFGFGGAVALSKVLPTQVTGASNVDMDAAIATLLGQDYVRTGYLGENMGVRLQALTDAIIPGTQNTTVSTMLPGDKVWMLAANRRKPMVIAFNSATPITLDIEASKSGDGELGINMTMSLDICSVFSNKVGLVTIS